MAYVAADADLRTPTVSNDAVWAKFAGTPMQGYEGTFLTLAQQYGIDPNWALAYLQLESRFGEADPSGQGMAYHYNPWDMVIATRPVDDPRGYVSPFNGWTYYRFGSMAEGLEAGFRNWASYPPRGWADWFSSLSVALCGRPQGCSGSQWVQSVIQQGQWNAQQWPYDGQPYTGGPTSPPGGGGDGGSGGSGGSGSADPGGEGSTGGGSGGSGGTGAGGAGPLTPFALGRPAMITLGVVAAGLLFTFFDSGSERGAAWQ